MCLYFLLHNKLPLDLSITFYILCFKAILFYSRDFATSLSIVSDYIIYVYTSK